MESNLFKDGHGEQQAKQAALLLMRISVTTLVAAAATAIVLAYVLAW
jgi:hypothetical protein